MNKIVQLFPLWIVLGALLSFGYPQSVTWFKGPLITWGLGGIMLGMALTLDISDFKRIGQSPKWVLSGVALQFLIMPFLGYTLAALFKLPTEFAVGLILVSCCPGGTASNVISFLAKANVALSVSMTAVSTFVAIVATPLLTSLLVHQRLEVNGWGLFISTVQVVLVPLVLGLSLKKFFPILTQRLLPVAPVVAVFLIVMIVSSVLGSGRQIILHAGISLFVAVLLLHVLGFALGFIVSWMINKDRQVAATTAIEVGMQNSGLGVVLAKSNFSQAAVSIPSALSSVCHCLIGSLFVLLYSNFSRK